MSDREQEVCAILDEAAAAMSLAHNLVRTGLVKNMIPSLHHELLTLRNEINTPSNRFDTAKIKALLKEVGSFAVIPKLTTKLASSSGSAALDLTCAYIKHAASMLSTYNQDSNELFLDCLEWLSEALYALSRYEESPGAVEDH